jgi:pseudouridine-5'-phosphate glycosidase
MALVVKENKFYMLIEKQGSKKEIRIFDEMKPAITMIRGSMKTGTSSENIELLSIEIKEEKFEIKTIPWNVIATLLIKE